MAASLWTTAAASVRGRGHEQTGTPCQDSSKVQTSPNGKWVALVASDGAGTAKYSDAGSRLVADEMAKCLIHLSEECDRRAPGAWVNDRIIQDIVAVRDRIRDLAGSDNISDYHCTLSAALVGPTGGLTIHLGDGAIFGGAADGKQGDVIDLANHYFVSAPQNGEYANETFFLTERDWVKNLRIHPIAAVDWVMLGTDGGMALAMVGESKPKSGFVTPVIRSLSQDPDFASRCIALARILDDRQADRLTNDDKTLIAAIRSQFHDVKGEFDSAANHSALSSTSLPSKTSAVAEQAAQGSGQPQAVTGKLIPSHSGERHASALRAPKPKWHWLLWTTLILTMAVFLAVGGWFFYMSRNPSGAPRAMPTPKSMNVSPADARDLAEKQTSSPANSAASGGLVSGGSSKSALPMAEAAETAVSLSGEQQPGSAERPKSQK